jgi:hypothetical protein
MPILLQWVRFFLFSFLYSYRAQLIVSSSRPSEEVHTLQEELGPNASRRSERPCPKEGMHQLGLSD